MYKRQNYLFEVPHNKGISTAGFWNKGVDWIFDTFFVYIKAFNTWLIVDVLQPMRALYLRMPAVATLVLVVGAGYLIGGIRSALVVCGLTLFIALSPWWDRALVTTYMATFGVVVSCIIGFTVGTLCFQNKHSTTFMLNICDIFQTFPSFVYLIPVMMLFGITDTSVLIAVIVMPLYQQLDILSRVLEVCQQDYMMLQLCLVLQNFKDYLK